MIFERIQHEDYEQIVYCNDPRVGLKAIISMHSTVLGPATGGCRMWAYKTEQEALIDVLRLSKGMTYKNSISGLGWGGGKAVIIGDAKTQKTPAMMERFGEFVQRLGGHYITAKDVGIGSEDLKAVKSKCTHVLGIDGVPGSSGDPSPATAWGVYHGMRAAAKFAFKSNSLNGLTVAMQGLGSVNFYMLEHIMADGAKVIACDIDQSAIERATKKYNIEIVSPDSIYDVKCDIFAPGALGATVNAKTLPRLQAKVIAGAANNQLATPEDGMEVMKRGIVYAPDYAINAGGLVNVAQEVLGYDAKVARERTLKIYDTIYEIADRSETLYSPTYRIADIMVEEKLAAAGH